MCERPADPVKIRNRYYLHKRVPRDIVATFAKTTKGKPKTHIEIPRHRWADAKRSMPDAEKAAQALNCRGISVAGTAAGQTGLVALARLHCLSRFRSAGSTSWTALAPRGSEHPR